ncbi:hypothetical protein FACS1894187_17500 [Synergistales bacterium]|nr:hypothetical protein FACS1894187_17500 [Synergistales bacterium]
MSYELKNFTGKISSAQLEERTSSGGGYADYTSKNYEKKEAVEEEIKKLKWLIKPVNQAINYLKHPCRLGKYKTMLDILTFRYVYDNTRVDTIRQFYIQCQQLKRFLHIFSPRQFLICEEFMTQTTGMENHISSLSC